MIINHQSNVAAFAGAHVLYWPTQPLLTHRISGRSVTGVAVGNTISGTGQLKAHTGTGQLVAHSGTGQLKAHEGTGQVV